MRSVHTLESFLSVTYYLFSCCASDLLDLSFTFCFAVIKPIIEAFKYKKEYKKENILILMSEYILHTQKRKQNLFLSLPTFALRLLGPL